MRTAPPLTVPRPRSTLLPRRLAGALIATGGLLLCSAGPAAAAGLSATGSAATPARVHGSGPAPAVDLPSATVATAAAAAPRDWLLGVTGSPARAAQVAAAHGGRFDRTLGVVVVPRSRATAAAAALGRSVSWATADQVARRTSSFDLGNGETTPWARSVAAAPSLTPAPGALARIGVVDDTVADTVAELASTDVVNGIGVIEPHGTMVASTAAAPFDGVGVVGVAPGAQVLSWGTTLTCTDVANGIVTLVRRGAQVVNLSLAFPERCPPLQVATSYAYERGVTIVAASGNDGDDGNGLSYPAVYPHVITAAAIDQSLTAASFSNFDDWVDLAAPGVDVPVDIPLRFDIDDGVRDGKTTVSGTSFASPYIAGGISWILGARPELDPSQVAAVLRAGAKDLGAAGWDTRTGYGLIQVAPSLAAPAPLPDALEPNDSPSFVRSSGTFRKKLVWTGGQKAATLTATGDSSDDPIDAYRIRVPARGRVKVTLQPLAGPTNLFAFDGNVRSFAGRPLSSSTHSGTAKDVVSLHNSTAKARDALVLVNTVPANDGQRALATYALKIARG